MSYSALSTQILAAIAPGHGGETKGRANVPFIIQLPLHETVDWKQGGYSYNVRILATFPQHYQVCLTLNALGSPE
jgi:hypothetical protein